MINGRTIVLGVTGGIAAYKTAYLASALTKAGANVTVAMTQSACRFITPLTFETLTKNAVITDTFDRSTPFEVTHVALAERAELIFVAPASADVIGKAANGIADDFLTTLLLAAKCPVAFAPAMNTAMLSHPAVQANIAVLKTRGAYIAEPSEGMLACGTEGAGRMPEPSELFDWIDAFFTQKDMKGLRVLVTAGPTRERIDDVRFLSNRSTGRMGYAIAQQAAYRGAEVTLVSGPVALEPTKGARLVSIESCAQMREEILSRFEDTDVVIKAAAVADYRPESKVDGKIKKSGDMSLGLVRTDDILSELGRKKTSQTLVGFAAETNDVERYARGKLERKNLDMICANDVSRADIGFGSENNAINIYMKDGSAREIGLADKHRVADAILDEVLRIRG